MVTLHTIDGGTVNAINDALLYDFVIGQNGIATGATVTSEGALLLHIDSGWGVIKGRIFSIEAETVSATPSASGTVKGRLILQIDITNTTNPITFVTQAAATLPALQQEDINGNGTIFQLPIATYDVNEVAVSNLQMVAPVVEAVKQQIDSVRSAAWKTLWTNTNIGSFNEQTININTQRYSWFLVTYIQFLNTPYSYITHIVPKGRSVSPLMVLGNNLQLAYRNIENLTDYAVTFSHCYKFVPGTIQQVVEDTWLIPYSIIGIK